MVGQPIENVVTSVYFSTIQTHELTVDQREAGATSGLLFVWSLECSTSML